MFQQLHFTACVQLLSWGWMCFYQMIGTVELTMDSRLLSPGSKSSHRANMLSCALLLAPDQP